MTTSLRLSFRTEQKSRLPLRDPWALPKRTVPQRQPSAGVARYSQPTGSSLEARRLRPGFAYCRGSIHS